MKPAKRREKRLARKVYVSDLPFPNMTPTHDAHNRSDKRIAKDKRKKK